MSLFPKQFTNLIASKHQKVGKGLQSCTSDINVIEATVDGKRVVVIDTPGIDDTHAGKKEADVLVDIANRLADMCVSAIVGFDDKEGLLNGRPFS